MSETFSKPLVQPAPVAFWAAAFWVPIAYAILRFGAVERTDWYLCLVGIGIATLAYHARTPRYQVAPAPSRYLRWTLIALPAYALWQILPIPIGLLQRLSPHRAEIASALDRIGLHQAFVPVSVVPSETLYTLSRICGCALLFFAARNLTWRWPERAWRVSLPLLVVASAEAILGLVQFFGFPDGLARGTYVNRNHFAGLLEMALPFAVAYPFAAMRRQGLEPVGMKPLLKSCLALTAAALMIAGITYSLSRSGFSVALVSLGMMATVAAASRLPKRTRIAAGVAVTVAFVTLFVLLPPDRLIERFGRLSQPDGLSADDRIGFWRDTTRLIAAYPVFGCGLGGFADAVHPFRTTALEVRLDYAHNDYLQALAELGIVGGGIVAVLIAALIFEAVKAVRRSRQMPLALGCLGALTALLAHSLTDFNLYIPANALVAAWVAGIASGLSRADCGRLHPRIIDVVPTDSQIWRN